MIGIYKIVNLVNGKIYVGKSSKGIEDIRWKEHLNDLKGNRHFNNHLQNAWNKYGEKSFEFLVLEECLSENLVEREEYWIDKLESYNSEKGYNLTKISKGKNILSVETKQKMSEAHMGKKFTKEHKQKLSEFRKGKTWEEIMGKEKSEELKEKYKEQFSGENNPFYGKQHSEESKSKMSESQKGLQSGENNPFYGKHHSEESKKKMRENRPNTDGENNPFYGKHHSEETKRRIGESKRGEKSCNAKLTLEQVKEIRMKYIPYEYSTGELAKEYGVSRSAIRNVLCNKTWKEGE